MAETRGEMGNDGSLGRRIRRLTDLTVVPETIAATQKKTAHQIGRHVVGLCHQVKAVAWIMMAVGWIMMAVGWIMMALGWIMMAVGWIMMTVGVPPY